MMDGHALLEKLRAAGLSVRVECNKLYVSPRDALTAELRELIKQNRWELMCEIAYRHATKKQGELLKLWAGSGEGLIAYTKRARPDLWKLIIQRFAEIDDAFTRRDLSAVYEGVRAYENLWRNVVQKFADAQKKGAA